jgi:carnitine O-acetyltransferase
MAVRTFTKPSSLYQALELPLSDGIMSQSNGEQNGKRSAEAAKNSHQSYSNEAQNPLATSKNGGSKPGITFAAQDKLPQLPIPDLESTCKKYVDALRPLQSSKEQRDTQISVKEFLQLEGPKLQARLKEYAEGKSNYIEQFCMFLSSRAKSAKYDG